MSRRGVDEGLCTLVSSISVHCTWCTPCIFIHCIVFNQFPEPSNTTPHCTPLHPTALYLVYPIRCIVFNQFPEPPARCGEPAENAVQRAAVESAAELDGVGTCH